MVRAKPINKMMQRYFPNLATFATWAQAADVNPTQDTLTDNSTGAAATTIAAGVGIQTLLFTHTFIGGTDTVEPVTNFTLGYKFKILSWAAITSVLLVGAGGSRVANLEIGTTDVGTVPSTCTIPIANAAVGTVTAATAVSGANTGAANATLSIEIASGGTQFTAGQVTFAITVQNMDVADAFASLIAQQAKSITDIAAIISSLQTANVMAS